MFLEAQREKYLLGELLREHSVEGYRFLFLYPF
jgi:hypothetical protein